MYSQVKLQRIRLFLIFEVMAFVLAALFHAGLFGTTHQHLPAFLAESALAILLGAALAVSLSKPRVTRGVSAAAHGIALVLTLITLITMVIGMETPRPVEAVYLAIMLLVLFRGLVISRKPLVETI